MKIQSQECSLDNHTTLGQSHKANHKVDTTDHMNVSDLVAKLENITQSLGQSHNVSTVTGV